MSVAPFRKGALCSVRPPRGGRGGVRTEADLSASVGEKGLPEGLECVSVNNRLTSLFVRISDLHRGCARQA